MKKRALKVTVQKNSVGEERQKSREAEWTGKNEWTAADAMLHLSNNRTYDAGGSEL